MLKLTESVFIDASASAVWAYLSKLESIHVWDQAIHRSYCPAQSRGIGAVRVCELAWAKAWETIVQWDEGQSFTYQAEDVPMFKKATNRWSIEARGNETLVTTSAEAVLKGGFIGRLLEPLLKLVFDRIGGRALALLKYYVEHGDPYTGKVSDLLRPPGRERGSL